jgi:hypothetical protein
MSEEVEPLVDIAGHTLAIGDTVVYPQQSGRSVQMVLGELISWNGKTAQIRRSGGSRWKPSYENTRYRDTRTGKNVNIYAGNYEHFEVKPRSYLKHSETGEELSDVEHRQRYPFVSSYVYGGGIKDDRYKWLAKYDQGVLKEYIEKYSEDAKPVTIKNVSNIVKVVVDGDVQEAEEPGS